MRGKLTVPRTGVMAASHIFKVMFVNQGKVYEIYARKVNHGALFGFIEVVFGAKGFAEIVMRLKITGLKGYGFL